MPKTVNLKIDYSQKTISNSVIIPWKVYDIVDVIISVLQKCPQGSVDSEKNSVDFSTNTDLEALCITGHPIREFMMVMLYHFLFLFQALHN